MANFKVTLQVSTTGLDQPAQCIWSVTSGATFITSNTGPSIQISIPDNETATATVVCQGQLGCQATQSFAIVGPDLVVTEG